MLNRYLSARVTLKSTTPSSTPTPFLDICYHRLAEFTLCVFLKHFPLI